MATNIQRNRHQLRAVQTLLVKFYTGVIQCTTGLVVNLKQNKWRSQNNIMHSTMFQLSPVKIEVNDIELQRQLTLSTADLRFADYLVQQVTDEQGNILTDDTGKVLY